MKIQIAIRLLLVILIIIIILSCLANGEELVLIAGGIISSNGRHIPCYWKDGKRYILPMADEKKGGYAAGICIYYK